MEIHCCKYCKVWMFQCKNWFLAQNVTSLWDRSRKHNISVQEDTQTSGQNKDTKAEPRSANIIKLKAPETDQTKGTDHTLKVLSTSSDFRKKALRRLWSGKYRKCIIRSWSTRSKTSITRAKMSLDPSVTPSHVEQN